MKLSEVIRALHHRTEGEYTPAQRRAAKMVAIGVLKRHLRWNDDCRPVVPSTAQEAFDKNAQFALSMRTVTECLDAICDVACDYDGYRERFGLAGLIDEMWALAMRGRTIAMLQDADEVTAYHKGHRDGEAYAECAITTNRTNAAHVASKRIRERMASEGLAVPAWLNDYEEKERMFVNI